MPVSYAWRFIYAEAGIGALLSITNLNKFSQKANKQLLNWDIS